MPPSNPFIRPKEEPTESTPKVRPYNAHRSLTASAAKVTNDPSEVKALQDRKASQKWQEEAWEYYDSIGEIKYAFNLFSNILSRIRLHAAYVEDDQDAPTPIRASQAPEEVQDAAATAMRAVFGGGKQAELLRSAGINLLVVGECYLINQKSFDHGVPRDNWRIVSTDEFVVNTNSKNKSVSYALKPRRNTPANGHIPLVPGTFTGRIWRQHPRYSDEPDSSMRALCDLCNELLLLSRTVRATARSRLNAGALFVPDSFSVGNDTETDQYDEDEIDGLVEEEHDEFEAELIDAMTTPVADEGSASAVVPLLIRGPAEDGDKIRHIKFERSFDPQLTNRADRALERILQGIDLPKEVVTGLSNIKYSNAIQINESFYTAHIEPLVLMLCDVFRTIYLEPYLLRAGIDVEEVDKVVIWYDPSGITTAPDKSSAANVGHDKMILSDDAWRRANGFTEDDMPTEDELARRLALTRGQLTPETTDIIFSMLWPELMAQVRQTNQATSTAPIPEGVQEVLDAGVQAPPNDPTEGQEAPTEAEPIAPEGLVEP